RILIVPFGTGIGDLVLQRGPFAGVAHRWPAAEVSVYAPSTAAALLPTGVHHCSTIFGIPAWHRVAGVERALALLGPWEWRAIDAIFRAIPLRAISGVPSRTLEPHYDLVVNLLRAFVSAIDFQHDWLPGREGDVQHVLDSLAEFLATIDVALPPSRRVLSLSIPPQDDADAGRLLATLAATRPRVLLNPHAGSPLKLPNNDFWIDLAAALDKQGITPLVVAGNGPKDRERTRKITAKAGLALPAIPLPLVVAVGRRCQLTISPDTALLHLIALDGQRWIGLFGSTNPYLTGPYNRSRGRLMIARPPRGPACLSCWQRFSIGSTCCPVFEAGSCLSTIDVHAVAAAAIEQMRGV
ncbi:MAG: glycosyltransferase family 9 protein, partial [Dehalococcoidia bacterium]